MLSGSPARCVTLGARYSFFVHFERHTILPQLCTQYHVSSTTETKLFFILSPFPPFPSSKFDCLVADEWELNGLGRSRRPNCWNVFEQTAFCRCQSTWYGRRDAYSVWKWVYRSLLSMCGTQPSGARRANRLPNTVPSSMAPV